MRDPRSAIEFARSQKEAAEEALKDFLRIPSVSTLPEHKEDMQRAAEWLSSQLEQLGFDQVAILPTAGHPVVYGEHMKAGASAPTILFYGHYDVQPADPLELWESEPFDPQLRGENLYARGASDMKGQVVAHLQALEAMLETGELPVNLKYMVEGEEEIGSPSLEAFIREHSDRLDCDFCLNADGGILGADLPSITYALRGLAYFELHVEGPDHDLHSGQFGGVVANPANVLARLIAGMHDADGKITLPGFYDQVRELSTDERAALSQLPQPDSWWQEQTGAPALWGEAGYSSTERAAARPTLDVNGLLSGFTGTGGKTVLPAKAMAKISMRLVPDQDPDSVHAALRSYLDRNTPDSVRWNLEMLASCRPGMVERDSDAVHAAVQALEAVWGKAPLFKREGGTVPVVGMIKDMLNVDSMMLGFGLPDDNLHAPNEKFHLPTFHRGIETFIRFTFEIAG